LIASTSVSSATEPPQLLELGLELREGVDVRVLEEQRDVARRLGLGRGTRPVRIGTASTSYTDAGERRITVRLTTAAKRRLRRLRSVSSTLRVSGADRAGNETAQAKRITLVR
jgi:hypothetical protein